MTFRLAIALVLASITPIRAEDRPKTLAPPVVDGPFLRPDPTGVPAQPVWGIKDGIAVGLWPENGPRGLIRIYAPYLDQPRPRMINFIAVEPITRRDRGLSELEPSKLDGVAGKAFWTGSTQPRAPWTPDPGKVEGTAPTRTLSFDLFIEPFDNGARPIVTITLREDQPREVEFRVRSAPSGTPMRSCILSATMGNYARLRKLHLKDTDESSQTLYPEDLKVEPSGFLLHRTFPLDRLLVRDGMALVAATPDEPDPTSATYAPAVSSGWRYRGKVATQYWRTPATPGLVARVNARRTFWASKNPIPGGVSFENFELEAPFDPATPFVFGVTTEPPSALGFPQIK